MADIKAFVISIIQLLVPEPCFEEFFVKLNFFHAVCLRVVLSKGLGYAIIAGSLMVKVPQILKIMNAQSAEGINLLGVTLELSAMSATLVYSFANDYPFSTYGESIFLLIQTWIVAVLVLWYTGRQAIVAIYSAILALILAFLLSPAASAGLLWFLQSSNIANIIIARMLQAFENYKNGSTGQLSVITSSMLWAGSLARIFTSWQETGDTTVIMTYVIANLCNSVILAQIIYYWNSSASTKEKKIKKKV